MEEPGRDEARPHALRAVGPLQRESVAANPGEATQRHAGARPVLERRIRDQALVSSLAALVQRDEAIRVTVRQRPQEDVVDDAEHGGRRADAEREGGHDGHRESPRISERTPSGSDVAQDDIGEAAPAGRHRGSHWGGDGVDKTTTHQLPGESRWNTVNGAGPDGARPELRRDRAAGPYARPDRAQTGPDAGPRRAHGPDRRRPQTTQGPDDAGPRRQRRRALLPSGLRSSGPA